MRLTFINESYFNSHYTTVIITSIQFQRDYYYFYLKINDSYVLHIQIFEKIILFIVPRLNVLQYEIILVYIQSPYFIVHTNEVNYTEYNILVYFRYITCYFWFKVSYRIWNSMLHNNNYRKCTIVQSFAIILLIKICESEIDFVNFC